MNVKKELQIRQQNFVDILMTYHKRNGAFIYHQGQAEFLIRILEIVKDKKAAFWLYCALVENILPLDYFKNSLYPQALLDYSLKCMKQKDRAILNIFTDSIKMFGMKAFYGLFTNL